MITTARSSRREEAHLRGTDGLSQAKSEPPHVGCYGLAWRVVSALPLGGSKKLPAASPANSPTTAGLDHRTPSPAANWMAGGPKAQRPNSPAATPRVFVVTDIPGRPARTRLGPVCISTIYVRERFRYILPSNGLEKLLQLRNF
jgi:hypothetical protein